jgi:serine/threonine protein phosphatase PrpC
MGGVGVGGGGVGAAGMRAGAGRARSRGTAGGVQPSRAQPGLPSTAVPYAISISGSNGHTTAASLTTGYAADQNARFRKHMEDEHTTVSDFADRRGSLFAGLYDGHGGRTAVEFVQQHLHSMVEREIRGSASGEVRAAQVPFPPSPPSARLGSSMSHARTARHKDDHRFSVCPVAQSPLDAITRAFAKIDRMLLQMGTLHCGTTAAVCLCLPGASAHAPTELHFANTGDTRIVLVSDGKPGRRISVDHVATDPEEVARVQRDGGHVVGNRVGGSLAVTRALGDHILKGDDGGVSCEPHVVHHTVAPGDRFVVMASDGVWDVMDDDEASDIVMVQAERTNDEIANAILQSALARGTRDNTSVLVVRLR